LLFRSNNGYTNVPECYVICTLPVLLPLLLNGTVYMKHLYLEGNPIPLLVH